MGYRNYYQWIVRILASRPDNNVLIRSGEARVVGWSRKMLYSGFNILPRSVFWSADLNGRSDNTDVIWLEQSCVRTETKAKIEIDTMGGLGGASRDRGWDVPVQFSWLALRPSLQRTSTWHVQNASSQTIQSRT